MGSATRCPGTQVSPCFNISAINGILELFQPDGSPSRSMKTNRDLADNSPIRTITSSIQRTVLPILQMHGRRGGAPEPRSVHTSSLGSQRKAEGTAANAYSFTNDHRNIFEEETRWLTVGKCKSTCFRSRSVASEPRHQTLGTVGTPSKCGLTAAAALPLYQEKELREGFQKT